MKKLFIILAAAILCVTVKAQSQGSKASKIGLTPVVSNELKIPEVCRRTLSVKTSQIVTRNGVGGISERYVLTPDVIVVSNDVVPTTPAQYSVKLEVVFFALDPRAGLILTQESFALTGVAATQQKAMIDALNRLDPMGIKAKQLIDRSRKKIIEHYQDELPMTLTKVQALCQGKQYDKALALLEPIPEQVQGYETVVQIMGEIYAQKIAPKPASDSTAMKDLSGAVDEWYKSQNK